MQGQTLIAGTLTSHVGYLIGSLSPCRVSYTTGCGPKPNNKRTGVWVYKCISALHTRVWPHVYDTCVAAMCVCSMDVCRHGLKSLSWCRQVGGDVRVSGGVTGLGCC